jgi:hypothetical protein
VRGAWLVPIMLCGLLAGCTSPSSVQPQPQGAEQPAPQSPVQPAPQSPAPTTTQEPVQPTSPTKPSTQTSVVGTWETKTTFPLAGTQVPATNVATFKADGTVVLTATSADIGELFSEDGTWAATPDGQAVQVKLADAVSTATFSGDKLVWIRSTWTKR